MAVWLPRLALNLLALNLLALNLLALNLLALNLLFRHRSYWAMYWAWNAVGDTLVEDPGRRTFQVHRRWQIYRILGEQAASQPSEA